MARTYLREARRLSRGSPRCVSYRSLLRQFPRWLRSQHPGNTPIALRIPWITFGSIEFLDGYVNPTMDVFEYGCGGSTLYFAARARRVVSVEHDRGWAGLVTRALVELRCHNAEVILQEPAPAGPTNGDDPSDPDAYVTSDERGRGKSFENYVRVIDGYAAGAFDIVLIDGRARPSCFKHARAKVRPGGIIVWDNMERAYYWEKITPLTEGFRLLDFPGPCPCLPHFTRTTIWQRLALSNA
jgi:hypothetical protein